ncbi:MAG: hypothetical protein BRC58_02000 [Cyanobacteria bacterium QS_8_64_29]|nr:MAG: hypothetical protein BRC58_02000 [Cyanobacteria bacterium QS_8_64_29]
METFAAIAYGLVALVGGIIGYLQARSQQSLISGTVSGILLLVAGIANALDQEWGTPLATVVTAVLIVVFVLRFQKTRKFMPAGLMVILGVLALLALVV